MTAIDLAGGVAVITGAASGIGRAMAQHAVRKLSMRVVLADISAEALQGFASELTSDGGDVLPVVTDVTDPRALDELARKSFSKFGKVSLLLNNAGIELLGYSWELPIEQWEKLLKVNIHGVVHGARAFLPKMIASGERCIVANMASIASVSIAPMQAGYVMSKHALLAFSECLRVELQMQQAGVQVSAILPGPVKTGIFDELDKPAGTDVAKYQQEMMSLLEQDGMPADEAAARIFVQLQQGEFWISTHPEMMRELAHKRATMLSDLPTNF